MTRSSGLDPSGLWYDARSDSYMLAEPSPGAFFEGEPPDVAGLPPRGGTFGAHLAEAAGLTREDDYVGWLPLALAAYHFGFPIYQDLKTLGKAAIGALEAIYQAANTFSKWTGGAASAVEQGASVVGSEAAGAWEVVGKALGLPTPGTPSASSSVSSSSDSGSSSSPGPSDGSSGRQHHQRGSGQLAAPSGQHPACPTGQHLQWVPIGLAGEGYYACVDDVSGGWA